MLDSNYYRVNWSLLYIWIDFMIQHALRVANETGLSLSVSDKYASTRHATVTTTPKIVTVGASEDTFKRTAHVKIPVEGELSSVASWRKTLHTLTPWETLKQRTQKRVHHAIKRYFENNTLQHNPYHLPNEQEPIPQGIRWHPKTGVVAQPIQEVLKVLLADAHVPGVIFGEIHDSDARNQVLIKHMPLFAKHGLKSIFLEGFADHPERGQVSQQDLDDYQNQPSSDTKQKLFDKMKCHLHGGETLHKVIEAAVTHGIKCYGVEDWHLYDEDDETERPVENEKGETVLRTNENLRDAKRNAHWAKVIQAHADRGKFFVLSGNFHSYDGARFIPEKDDKYFGVDHLLPGVMSVDVVDERCRRHPIFRSDKHEYLDFPKNSTVDTVFIPLDPAQRAQADFVWITPLPHHPQRSNRQRAFDYRRQKHPQKHPLFKPVLEAFKLQKTTQH
jgi:hypothetical protein